MAVAVTVAMPAAAQNVCKAPKPVCAAKTSVFAMASAFDPYSSAVRIGPGLLISNRHAVADETRVRITLADGKQVIGDVVPSSYEADLVLIRAELPEGPVLKFSAGTEGDLYAIGQDISRRAIRVFPKGRLLKAPDETKPFSRLHHTAYTQPGASGGALVNASGELVGIVTSGGAGRFEAIPSTRIDSLQAKSGEDHAARSAALGKAYRDCTIDIEKAQRVSDALPDDVVTRIETACAASANRQLFDLAGQVLAKSRKLDQAIAFFERSLEKDPNAINSRIGFVITLMFARKNAEALSHVRWLMKAIPESTEVQRFAVHVGKRAGDMALAKEGLALIKKHNPAQYEAAKRFVDAPLPQRLRKK